MHPPTKSICCVVTRNYFPRLIATYLSVLEFNEIPLHVLVVDIEPSEKAATAEALRACLPPGARDAVQLICLEEVFPGKVESLRFYYDAFELVTAGKAGLHHWMDTMSNVERWLYLDVDILCFGSLDPLFDSLGSEYSILLTPHSCEPTDNQERNILFLSYGCFNAGVLGIRRTTESSKFTRWYHKVLTTLALFDTALPAGSRFIQSTALFADQRWLDLVPGYFGGVLVARRRGFNLGYWNIGDDRLRRVGGDLYAGDEKVVLLHLSGWQSSDPSRFSGRSKHDFSADEAWNRIHREYCRQLDSVKDRFPAIYRFASYPDGSPIPKSHRRAYLRRLGKGNPPLRSPFAMKEKFERLVAARRARAVRTPGRRLTEPTGMENGMNREGLPAGDYVSPNLSVVRLDHAFPNMVSGDASKNSWPYLRRRIPHNWYVDRRGPDCGFLSRDEAHIVYHAARQFQGKHALEIGCWYGWSAAHLAFAGVRLDVIDPLLAEPAFRDSVTASLGSAGLLDNVQLHAGSSPGKVRELQAQAKREWSLIFIDGDHEGNAPRQDAIACAPHAAADAMILFHDLASPHVAAGLDYLRSQGWQTMVYETMQIMGVAWRGNVTPVEHHPDPAIADPLPGHLRSFRVSGAGPRRRSPVR